MWSLRSPEERWNLVRSQEAGPFDLTMYNKLRRLELYRELLLQQAKDHFYIRYNGKPNSAELVESASQKYWQDYVSKIEIVPARYTVALLKTLLHT